MIARYATLDRSSRLILVLLSIYLFIYVFAVPMVMFDLVPVWGIGMGGFLNMLQGALLLIWLHANTGWRGPIAGLLIVALSWLTEHLGVTTGWPFGRYTYSDGLGAKIIGVVPFPIPFAWLLVIPASIGAARCLGARRGWQILALTTALVVAFDLLLEPFAVYVLRYWRWIDSGPYYGVPMINFVAWGALGLILTVLTLALCGPRIVEPRVLPQIPALLFALNIVQFTLVDLVYGYRWAALVGVLLIGVATWRWRHITADSS